MAEDKRIRKKDRRSFNYDKWNTKQRERSNDLERKQRRKDKGVSPDDQEGDSPPKRNSH